MHLLPSFAASFHCYYLFCCQLSTQQPSSSNNIDIKEDGSSNCKTYTMSPSPLTSLPTPVSKKIAMHWFRKGLRLHDNPALLHSLTGAAEVYPVYVLDGDCYQLLRCTALRANFLVECLIDLDAMLRKAGSRLYVVEGDPVSILPTLWKDWGITHLSHELDETGEPYATQRDAAILSAAREEKIHVHAFGQETLYPLASYFSKLGCQTCISMTAFQTLFNSMPPLQQPKDSPTKFPINTHPCEGLYLPPKQATDLPWPRNTPRDQVSPVWGPDDCKNLTPLVRGGESRALTLLHEKTVMSSPSYVATFEKPNTSCTSLSPSTTALSPYMSLGCLSPRTFWFAIQAGIDRYINNRISSARRVSQPPVSLHGQLLWRDFNNLVAASANRNAPGSWGRMEHNLYCRNIPWDNNLELLEAWTTAQTGYPWIDACMMQLKKEGWVHHLGRHAVACFLTRGDLWQSWERGAEHFESHLLDADYALNGFNWLWLSCSGFFYQYFRCYSPVAFQKKNDPTGQYIRRYLPALSRLPDKYIYEPWKAPEGVQKSAGVIIGKDYPMPIVDHAIVSKENMGKMSYAYEQCKDKDAKGTRNNAGKGDKIGNKRKASKDDDGTVQKKREEQTQATKREKLVEVADEAEKKSAAKGSTNSSSSDRKAAKKNMKQTKLK
jgi:cryptochrome